ncbi:MAG TPA: hypothetical protein VGN04_08455 [Herbaspirillum sp.]|jgi:hypothetical protein
MVTPNGSVYFPGETKMDKYILGWMLGVPMLVLIALQYFMS